MSDMHERTRILIGEHGLARLAASHVLIAGLGGVGGAAAEACARAGVGRITLLDHDVVDISNLNRQIIALHSNLGQPKARVAAERLRDINPAADITVLEDFLHPDNADALLSPLRPDAVLDCIDSVVCKAALVHACQRQRILAASSLGAGGRTDVTRVRIARLDETQGCGLARALRRQLRRRGARLDHPVVHSGEPARNALPHRPPAPGARPRATNGTVSWMPNLFGFMLAGYVLEQLAGQAPEQ